MADRVLPAAVLWFLFWPLSAVRATRAQRNDLDRRAPLSHLPPGPGDRMPSRLARWRFHFELSHQRMVLSWPDHMREPRWRRRFSVTGFQGLRELADRGPVILFSLHTVPAYVLPPWVRTLGIQAASVAVDPGWFEEDILRRSALSQPGSARTTFAIGEARALVRHLQAGHCLILFADHPAGHTVDVDWRGSSLRLSTGGFRLAAQTGATVVPVAITTSGRWRYRVHVGQPLPEDVVRAGDQLPAARLVVNELMTALAETPQQADLTLIDSLRPQRPAAAAA